MALIEKKRAILIFIFQKLLGGTIRASNFACRSLRISSVSLLSDYTNEEIPNMYTVLCIIGAPKI